MLDIGWTELLVIAVILIVMSIMTNVLLKRLASVRKGAR